MKKRHNKKQVLDILRKRINEAGSGVRFGKTHDFTSSYLTQVFKGDCPISDRLLESIGFCKVVEYESLDGKD